MRLYSVDDEVRLGLGRDLRDWAKAGLLSPEQATALGADLATDLRRTGMMLRLGLAAFTVIAGAAGVALVLLVTDLDSEVTVSIVTAVLGAAALAAAFALVRRFRLYRYGVEEALVLGAVGLFGASAALLTSELVDTTSAGPAWSAAMVAVALTCGVAYRRLGLRYAAIIALYAVAMVPAAADVFGVEVKRFLAAAVCAAAYVYATRVRRGADDDVRRGDAAVVRAAAAVGTYLALNGLVPNEAFGATVPGWYRWTSWVATWVMPVLIARAGVIERDPLLLRVAIVAGLATLATNKAYLGWPRHPWDPMLLGILLVGVAMWVRHWLSAGANGERQGFTARQLLDRDDATVQLASLASVTLQPEPPVRPAATPEDPSFSGGRSGGAGAGTTF